MSEEGLPLVVLNMGAEMVYILRQRLSAQKITDDKASRVLNEVSEALLNEVFLGQLLRPQKMYSHISARRLFSRLAHSSIMRLSDNSMDKLYDLMMMGFKAHVFRCAFPMQLIEVTMNHLQELQSYVSGQRAEDVVQSAQAKFMEYYGHFSPGKMARIRQHLSDFFLDRNIKVSLFLQDGSQLQTGKFVSSIAGHVPPGGDVPGRIRMLRLEDASHFEFPHPFAKKSLKTEKGSYKFFKGTTSMGKNIYGASSSSSTASSSKPTVGSPEKKPSTTSEAEVSALASPSSKTIPPSKRPNALEELDLLSSLVVSHGGEGSIKLNILDDIGDDTYGDAREGKESEMIGDGYTENVIVASRTSQVKSQLRDLAKDLEESTSPPRARKVGDTDARDTGGCDDDEDDLLDLMDQM